MIKIYEVRKFFKVISILLIFALLVGCATFKYKPNKPNTFTLNKDSEKPIVENKKDIAICGMMILGDNKSQLIIDIPKVVKKFSKSKQVDYINVEEINSEEAIKNIIKDYYKILILINSKMTKPRRFMRYPEYQFTIKVIDLEIDKEIYYNDKLTSKNSAIESLASIVGLLIDFPFTLALGVPVLLISDGNSEVGENILQYCAPFNGIMVPSMMKARLQNKFKKPAYSCLEVLEDKYQRPSNLNLIVKFNDRKTYHPNNILEAAEVGELEIKINNKGKDIGLAYNTNLILNSDNPSIIIESKRIIGEIAPDKLKYVTIPIKCDLNATDGNATNILFPLIALDIYLR